MTSRMTLGIESLTFILPDNLFGDKLINMQSLSADLDRIKSRAGTDNKVFKAAFTEVCDGVQMAKPLDELITSAIQVRALAMLLQTELKSRINITSRLLDKINLIVGKPSSLLIERFYQYFLLEYDQLSDPQAMGLWLIDARKKRNIALWFDVDMLGLNGPAWLAERAMTKQLDFDHQLRELGLANYASGRYLTSAKNIYYVEQLHHIAVNAADDLLIEVQKPAVFESRYDDNYLLGHKILNVLISRAPSNDISDAWLNVIMAIAGDPRISPTHPRYLKWWGHITPELIVKMHGWLSKLDLKLFLEALENFSKTASDPELLRMFPSRKYFLEGMFNAGVITKTRLFLSRAAAKYLRSHYKSEHLPNFSVVSDGNKSIIYVQMGDKHMIEGSHSCYLWLYDELHPSAVIFDDTQDKPSYHQLTTGLSDQMARYGIEPVANIQHNPINFSWQKTALTTLTAMGVQLTAKDVLTAEDYGWYKRQYGVS